MKCVGHSLFLSRCPRTTFAIASGFERCAYSPNITLFWKRRFICGAVGALFSEGLANQLLESRRDAPAFRLGLLHEHRKHVQFRTDTAASAAAAVPFPFSYPP